MAKRGQTLPSVDLLEVDTGVPRDCLLAALDDRVGWRKRVMVDRLVAVVIDITVLEIS